MQYRMLNLHFGQQYLHIVREWQKAGQQQMPHKLHSQIHVQTQPRLQRLSAKHQIGVVQTGDRSQTQHQQVEDSAVEHQ